jgi:hypothetical protein
VTVGHREQGLQHEFLLQDAQVIDEPAGQAPPSQQSRVKVAQEGRLQGGRGGQLVVKELEDTEGVRDQLEVGHVH